MSHVIGHAIRRQQCPEDHAGTTLRYSKKEALAAIKQEKTISELAQQFDVHPNQITQWKTQLLERAGDAFEGNGPTAMPQVDITVLHAKIGALTL